MIPSGSIASISTAQVRQAAIPAQQPPAQQAQPVEAPEDIFQIFNAAVAQEEAIAAANDNLHHAATEGRTQDVIQALVDGANINHTTVRDHDTALIQAARQGHAETVQELLARGADIAIENIRGGSALAVALYYNRQNVLNTFFHHAAQTGRLGVINGLSDRNAVDINHQDANGDTALIQAARNGRAATVQTLLNRGADASITNNRGGTALMSAQRHHRQNVIDVFTAHAEELAAAQGDAEPAAQPHQAAAAPAHANEVGAGQGGEPEEVQIEGVPGQRAEREPEPGEQVAHQA